MLGLDLGRKWAAAVWLSPHGTVRAAVRTDVATLLREGRPGALGTSPDRLEAVLAVPFDASTAERAAAERAAARAGLVVLGVVHEQIAAALGRVPQYRPAPRPVRLLVHGAARFAAVVEWEGTTMTTRAVQRTGEHAAPVLDRVLASAELGWGHVDDVVLLEDPARSPLTPEIEARWGRPVVPAARPDLVVAFGAAKVAGYRGSRYATTPAPL